jgi:hypothetical protein
VAFFVASALGFSSSLRSCSVGIPQLFVILWKPDVYCLKITQSLSVAFADDLRDRVTQEGLSAITLVNYRSEAVKTARNGIVGDDPTSS